jgi:hypothetical protein
MALHQLTSGMVQLFDSSKVTVLGVTSKTFKVHKAYKDLKVI